MTDHPSAAVTNERIRVSRKRIADAESWCDARPTLCDETGQAPPQVVAAALRLAAENPEWSSGKLERVLVWWLNNKVGEEAT